MSSWVQSCLYLVSSSLWSIGCGNKAIKIKLFKQFWEVRIELFSDEYILFSNLITFKILYDLYL